MPDQTRNLNSVTDFTGTLDSNDRIIMTDNKASLKALTTAILGKAMVEGYTGSSLAGANQSVKSAVDALNSNTYSFTLGTRFSGTIDFDTLTTVGNYYCDGNVTATNGPENSILGTIKVEHSVGHDDNYLIQTYRSARDDKSIYRRIRNNGNWRSWGKLATRDEVDALNSKFVSENTGLTAASNVTLSNAYHREAGSIVLYHFVITTTAAITRDTDLVTGATVPALAANGGGFGFAFNNSTQKSRVLYLTGSGSIRCDEDIASGENLRCEVVYGK